MISAATVPCSSLPLADATLLGVLLALGGVGLLGFFALALLAAFGHFLRQLRAGIGGLRAGGEPLPYRRVEALFTPAEAAFLPVLARAAGPEVAVYGKVRLADLIVPREGLPRPRFLSALHRVTSKHVDFVLCERASLLPLAAVELDDRSHRRADRRERDRFVEAALAAAGLPLLRFPVRANGRYPAREIEEALASVLDGQGGGSPRVEAAEDAGQALAARGR